MNKLITKTQLSQTAFSTNFFEINVEGKGIINALKVKNFGDMKNCKRLFFEQLINPITKTKNFIEIENVHKFIEGEEYLQKLNTKHNCFEESYIELYNFHVIL